jgi:signal transduction histidine kinase/HAMP domain-containing protein
VRRRVRRHRLVNRLVLAAAVAGLGAGIVGAVLLQRSSGAAALREARQRNAALADQYAVRLDSRVENLIAALRLVASRDELAPGDAAAAAAELRVVLRVASTLDELVLYDTDGRPAAAAASRFDADPADYGVRPELVRSAAGEGAVDVDTGDAAAVEVAVAVEDPPGHVVGALVGRAPLATVTAPIEGVLGEDDPVPFLVDADGVVLVHRDRSRVVEGQRFSVDEILGGAGRSAVLDRDGHEHVYAAARSERLDAVVVVEQRAGAARAAVDDNLREQLAILGLAMLAAVGAVIVAGEVLLRPLGPLTRAVARVGRGERGVRTRSRGYGEIGVLATEVDRMAGALDRRDNQLTELQELSLLVGSLSGRDEVAERVAAGAASLVGAAGAAVCLPLADAASPRLEVAATAGAAVDRDRLAALAVAATEHRAPVPGSDESPVLRALAVPLVGAGDDPIGAIVVHRPTLRFGDEDEAMLVAFASFAAVAFDNARRLDLQRALADQLQEAVDRRRDLIGTITHEFRTPLACIEGFATALTDGWSRYDDAERRDLADRIARHAEELDELVNRFLDFTVTERGALSAQVGDVHLDTAVSQAIDALAPLLADRRTEVAVPPVVVRADAVLLRRTFANLLSNAVKYSTAGSLVAVRAAVEGRHVRVEVVDEGVGLSHEDAARAFEPFWRGGASSTRAARGAGLGLALVAEYVGAMGGTVAVDSVLGRGSTFSFTLPLATVGASVGAAGEGSVG